MIPGIVIASWVGMIILFIWAKLDKDE